MYRRRPGNLPVDPIYPHNLEQLGYKIDENDCITSLKYPGEHFQFFITNNDRHNDVQREAMHDCVRHEIALRLIKLGVPRLYFPTFTEDPPPSPQPHLPIHCTPLRLLANKTRIVVIIDRSREDLGILSYRVLSRSGGINKGSVVGIVQDIQNRAEKAAKANGTSVEDEKPGIIILNTGQLLFSHKEGQAVTPVTWEALHRKSATHPAAQIHDQYNRIEGNKTFQEHIRFVFKNLLGRQKIIENKAELYIIGLAEGGDEVVNLLNEVYEPGTQHPRHRVAALALTAPISVAPATSNFPLEGNQPFLNFLRKRARAWRLSSWELNTPEANAMSYDEVMKSADDTDGDLKNVQLYPEVSGGEEQNEECIITVAYGRILDWFDEVKEGGGVEGYEHGVVEIPEKVKAAVLEGLQAEQFGW